MRVAIHARLSSDPTGQQTATERQARACEQFAAARDWTVEHVIEDVDVSAYDKKVRRPGFERLRRLIAGREIDVVMVWKLDRLVRRPGEFESFWEACDAAHVTLVSATEPIDTSHELGLALVRILVTFASLESATISVRSKASNRAAAERGAPHSGPVPYGHTARMSAVVGEEAAALREAAQRVLAGEPLQAICDEFTARGVTMRGHRFTTTFLRRTLIAPRLVGDRSYYGQVVATDCWPAILDRVTGAKFVLSSRRSRG